MEDPQTSTLSPKDFHTETQMDLITAAGTDYLILQVSHLILYNWLLGANLGVEILGEIKQVQLQAAHPQKAPRDETGWGRQPGWPWRAAGCALRKGSVLTTWHPHHPQLHHCEPRSNFNHNLLVKKPGNLSIYYDYFLAAALYLVLIKSVYCNNCLIEDTQFDHGKLLLVKHQK